MGFHRIFAIAIAIATAAAIVIALTATILLIPITMLCFHRRLRFPFQVTTSTRSASVRGRNRMNEGVRDIERLEHASCFCMDVEAWRPRPNIPRRVTTCSRRFPPIRHPHARVLRSPRRESRARRRLGDAFKFDAYVDSRLRPLLGQVTQQSIMDSSGRSIPTT